jgi:hypothetical protein
MRSQIQNAWLNTETLEDRAVPSTTLPDADLSARGATVQLADGVIVRQIDAQPTGTGFIDSFVRLQAKGTGAQIEQGFNTDARPLQFDENTSPQFTRSLKLSDVPEVIIGGTKFREFLLDINQKASQPLLSLDALRIFVASAGNLSGLSLSTNQLAGIDAVYDLDAGGDHWIKLNSRLNQGSGKGDMAIYIPSSYFAGADPNSYLYLYSRFGDNLTGNADFEEWSVASSPLTCTHGVITGTVTDSFGNGLFNVEVFLDANRNGMLDDNEVFTFTDSEGHYEFLNLATGLGDLTTYSVRVMPAGDFSNPDPESILIPLDNCEATGIANFKLTNIPNS